MANITLPGFDERDPLRQNVSLRHVAEDLKANYAPLVSPAFTTPSLGVATATSLNGLTITSTTGTLTVALGKTLTWSNTITIAGTDGSTLNVGAGGTLGSLAYLSAAPAGTLTGTTLNATVVTSSLTGLGTVTTGVWQATAVGAAYGGTGQTSLTANNVILGNGTSAVQFVAPGASGNLLTSDGTTWQSTAPVPTWTRTFKTADQNLATSSTAYQDVTSLSFEVAANTSYFFNASVIITSPATGSSGGGIKLSCNGPSGASSMHFAGTVNGTDGTAYDTTVVDISAQSTQYTMVLHVRGVINNGSTAGTVIIRASQRASATGVTVVRKGSYIESAVVQ